MGKMVEAQEMGDKATLALLAWQRRDCRWAQPTIVRARPTTSLGALVLSARGRRLADRLPPPIPIASPWYRQSGDRLGRGGGICRATRPLVGWSTRRQ